MIFRQQQPRIRQEFHCVQRSTHHDRTPAWRPIDGQHTRVFAMPGGERWAVRALGAQLTVTPLDGASTAPQADEFALDAGSPGGAAELLAALGGITPSAALP